MKSRITITLSQDLLRLLDQTIDHYSIRNRSQAIEAHLRKAIRPQLKTAVVLAGGNAAQNSTNKLSAPLATIDDKPLILHTLNHLKTSGVDQVIFCTTKITHQHLKNLIPKDIGIKISYSIEPEPLGTGGAIKKINKTISSNPFLLIHGDVLSDIRLDDFLAFHYQQKKLVTIAVKPRPGILTYGQVFMEGTNIVNFEAAPKPSPISLINTGIYIMDQKIFAHFPNTLNFNLETQVFPKISKNGQVAGFIFQGIWFDVSQPANLKQALKRWPHRDIPKSS